jgi:hypothetical protein
MPDTTKRERAIARLLILGLVGMLAGPACGTRAGAPPRSASASEPAPDGGLPPPPRSTKKGVIVPSDMGLGQGPSGLTSTSGTAPAESPVLGSPNVGN